MRERDFTPHLFIGIGATSAFFTLRETYLHYVPGPGAFGNAVVNGVFQGHCEIRSYHINNLSQDADAAVEKAQEYAERMGLELRTNAEALKEEMRDIQRATAEEIAARRKREEDREAEYKAARAAWENEAKELAATGVFPIGPYRGKKFTEAPLGYLNWMMDKVEEFSEGSLLRFVAEKIIEMHPELQLPKPAQDLHVGEPNKRLTFKVTVLRVSSFLRPGFGWNARPETCYVTTMVTDNKECLVCFSGAFAPDVGEELTIKATVKEHTEYNGQAQTVVQRVKVL